MTHPNRVIVVGAGPAGMMAAIRASQLGAQVTLLEKNAFLGKKLFLSGKGRCNLTNACPLDEFLKRFSGNGQFLRDAFAKFFNRDLIRFFEERGLKLKVERQERVFPVTDRSSSITDVLEKELRKNKVEVLYKTVVKDIILRDKQAVGVITVKKSLEADKVILACGGASYAFTGSTAEGIKLAAKTGHRIVNLRSGLVPVEIEEKYPNLLEGLTLKNIRLRIISQSKEITSEIGELLFTGFGVSGPLVLSLSGMIGELLQKDKRVRIEIDLKPGLSAEQLDNRLLRDFKLSTKKSFKNILKELLPLRLISLFINLVGIPAGKKVNQISQQERIKIIALLKGFCLTVKGLRPLEEAMVTRGGVSLKDISPRTMESRLIKGLHFCGEMLDVDADTGGFNLQAAFSTGYLAGESAALS